MHIGFWLGNLRKRERLECLGMGKTKKKVTCPCPRREGIWEEYRYTSTHS
jgi:hypothetical protein